MDAVLGLRGGLAEHGVQWEFVGIERLLARGIVVSVSVGVLVLMLMVPRGRRRGGLLCARGRQCGLWLGRSLMKRRGMKWTWAGAHLPLHWRRPNKAHKIRSLARVRGHQ